MALKLGFRDPELLVIDRAINSLRVIRAMANFKDLDAEEGHSLMCNGSLSHFEDILVAIALI